jgi:hypothetical protein
MDGFEQCLLDYHHQRRIQQRRKSHCELFGGRKLRRVSNGEHHHRRPGFPGVPSWNILFVRGHTREHDGDHRRVQRERQNLDGRSLSVVRDNERHLDQCDLRQPRHRPWHAGLLCSQQPEFHRPHRRPNRSWIHDSGDGRRQGRRKNRKAGSLEEPVHRFFGSSVLLFFGSSFREYRCSANRRTDEPMNRRT